MLNKNANCYNIEKNFKYSTVSQNITIFRTLSIDIWQLKCQLRQTNKTKNGKLSFYKLFRIITVFLIIHLRKATLKSKVSPLIFLTRRKSNIQLKTATDFLEKTKNTRQHYKYRLQSLYCGNYPPITLSLNWKITFNVNQLIKKYMGHICKKRQ